MGGPLVHKPQPRDFPNLVNTNIAHSSKKIDISSETDFFIVISIDFGPTPARGSSGLLKEAKKGRRGVKLLTLE